MSNRWRFLLVFFALAALCASQAKAGPIVLTFEGLQDQEQILNFYNGGFGGLGSGPGPSDGIVFGSDSLALIAGSAGGSGNFSGNPSGNTIAFFLSGAGDVMDVAGGFNTGFSFFYASTADVGSVTVWSGLDGTGTLLATLTLPALGGCANPPNFCDWAPIGVTFGGTAESAVFSGTANQIGFDDITLGSSTPGTVPEPSAFLLLGFGLFVLALRRQLA